MTVKKTARKKTARKNFSPLRRPSLPEPVALKMVIALLEDQVELLRELRSDLRPVLENYMQKNGG